MPGELTEGTNPQGGCLCALVMPTGMGEMSAWYGSGNCVVVCPFMGVSSLLIP